jgi:hypothetical protein
MCFRAAKVGEPSRLLAGVFRILWPGLFGLGTLEEVTWGKACPSLILPFRQGAL